MTTDEHPYQTVSSKIVYENPWMKIRENQIIRPDGSPGIYAVMESRDSVMITVLNDNQQLYLVRAYSYPSQSWNWELPGGGGDGEEPVKASKRELHEETGIIAEKWTPLGKTRVCNGFMTERMSTYLAEGITFAERDHEDKAIISKGEFFDLDTIGQMIHEGIINDGQSIAGIYLLMLRLNK